MTDPNARFAWAIRYSTCLFCAALPLSIAGANMSWALILLSLLAYAAAGGRPVLHAHGSALEKPLWIYLAVALVASALGTAPLESLRRFHQDLHKVWLYALLSVALATESDPRAFIWMASGFALASIVGIAQAAVSYMAADALLRAHAFVHPLVFGSQLCIAVLGAACLLVRPTAPFEGPRARKFIQASLLLACAALLLSQARGPLLSCVCGLLAVAALLPALRRPLLLFLPLGTAAWLLVHRLSWRYGAEWSVPTPGVVQGQLARLELWRTAWSMGKDHLWTGVGPHNFRANLPRYLQATFEDGGRSWGSAENLYLHQFAERGLIGLAALVLLLGTLWLRSLQRVRERPDAWNLWAFGASTAFLLMNLTESAFQIEIVWMLMFFVWIWAEAQHRRAQEAR